MGLALFAWTGKPEQTSCWDKRTLDRLLAGVKRKSYALRPLYKRP
jgi:hypothetical protein